VRVAATVEAIATPIAPPICWEVLSSPEATPPSWAATPARAPIDYGMKASVQPPVTKSGPARSAQKFPCA
jgi:hypothetical protein